MRAYARSLLLAALVAEIVSSVPLNAAGGIYLPPSPQGSGGEDTIESSSGTRCRQSINSNGAYLDVGVVGSAAGGSQTNQQLLLDDARDREGMAYARLTVPLGRRPKRIECSRIFELEIARLKREVEILKMNAE